MNLKSYWLFIIQIPYGIIVAITCDTSISKLWLTCPGLNKSFPLDAVFTLSQPSVKFLINIFSRRNPLYSKFEEGYDLTDPNTKIG